MTIIDPDCEAIVVFREKGSTGRCLGCGLRASVDYWRRHGVVRGPVSLRGQRPGVFRAFREQRGIQLAGAP